MTGAPAHQRAALAWLTRAGIAWTRERYARPEAGGETGAYRLRPAGTPRGRIVAAHGAGNDALFPLLTLFAAVVARGFEVFAWDGDGQGFDTTTRFHPKTIRSSVAAAVAASAAGEPALRTHLLGHSLGGALVLGALADGGVPGVRSAAVLAAPTGIRVGLRVSLAELGGFLHPATFVEMRRYGGWGVVPAVGTLKRAAFPFRLMEARAGGFGYVGAIVELLGDLDLEQTADDIAVPVQLVYGGRDALVPVAQGERLARAMPGAELVRVPAATHWTLPLRRDTHGHVVRWMEEMTPAAGGEDGG